MVCLNPEKLRRSKSNRECLVDVYFPGMWILYSSRVSPGIRPVDQISKLRVLGICGTQQQWYGSPKVEADLEFNDNFFDCPFGDASNPACTAYTGNFVMDQLGIPRDYVTTGCLALVGFVAFYLVTTVLFLQFLPVQITFSKQVHPNERENGTAEAVARAKSAEQRPAEVAIHLQDLRLWIDKYGFKRLKKHILNDITADFEPGKLNVIMGPSGTYGHFTSDGRLRKK